MEYLRSFLLTGFPWGILSYSQYARLPFIQMADITGPYGLSFVIVVVNVAFYRTFRDLPRKRIPVRETTVALSCLAVFLGYGYVRMEGIREREAARPSLKIGLAQGNIDQALKWDEAFQAETVRIYERLTIEAARSKPDLVIWPETATPFFFQDAKQFQPLLFGIAQTTQSYLLFGSPSYRVDRGKVYHYNSAYLLSPAGAIEGKYDKIHLVPYGEYVPLSDLISIGSLGEGIGNFSPGREIKTLSTPKARFGVAICFEIIFPDLCRRIVKQGADFLVTLTNDAWYGRTSAPYQHLTIAVFRAVENRVWVARAANTGISGLIDPTGRIVKQSGLFTQEALTGDIRLMAERSFYTLWGDVFAWFCSAVVAGFLAFAWGRGRTRGESPGKLPKSTRPW
jgi:apolipoprotein N-acyltransferase